MILISTPADFSYNSKLNRRSLYSNFVPVFSKFWAGESSNNARHSLNFYPGGLCVLPVFVLLNFVLSMKILIILITATFL